MIGSCLRASACLYKYSLTIKGVVRVLAPRANNHNDRPKQKIQILHESQLFVKFTYI